MYREKDDVWNLYIKSESYYASGVLEGYLTSDLIYLYYSIIYKRIEDIYGQEMMHKLFIFINSTYNQLLRKLENTSIHHDEYWITVNNTLSQIKGIVYGQNLYLISEHVNSNLFILTLTVEGIKHYSINLPKHSRRNWRYYQHTI